MMDDVQLVSASHWFGHDTGMGGEGRVAGVWCDEWTQAMEWV